MRLARLGLFLLAACSAGRAAAACPIDGPAAKLRDAGIEAAQRQDWQVAFECLARAQEKAPEDASILYALGVAHSKAGDFLPALFWLKAYLLADLHAKDVVTVANEISELEKEARAREEELYKIAVDTGRRTKVPLDGVAMSEAEAGHIESALALAEDAGDRDTLWTLYAGFSMRVGKLQQAKEALGHVRTEWISFKVASFCNSNADPHRWDGIGRVEAESRFLTCLGGIFGPQGCAGIEVALFHEALDAIRDPAIKAQARRDSKELVDEWDKAAGRTSRLRKWLACERGFGSVELDALQDPQQMQRRSFADPARVPRVISSLGADLGKGLARFRALEARLK